MAHVTTITNQKGGVGKTTTAHALSTGLNIRGCKTLVIDTDPQGNLSYTYKVDNDKPAIYDVLKGNIEAFNAIQHTDQGDIIPSNILSAGADLEFTDTGREYILKDIIESLNGIYDYIIIDSPPTLGILTINALAASNDIIIPMGADIYSLQGLSQLYITINKVKKYCNPSLSIAGILITRYNGRSILSKELKEVIESKANQIKSVLFNTVIREGIAIREAQTQQDTVFNVAPKSNVAIDYLNFINEYIEGVKMNG